MCYLCTIFVSLITFIFYMKLRNGRCKSEKCLVGNTCLVNGGTSGIGIFISMDLAKRGARVIITGPFREEGAQALKTIVKETGNTNVNFKLLDLTSLKSTREFAENFLQKESRLDILMNNAGVAESVYKLTGDNLSSTMQVNFYGHVLLTILLLPLLKKSSSPSGKSRIVNTTSRFHTNGQINFGNMNNIDNSYKRVSHYSNSKLCQIIFSRELTRRLKGSNVVINNAEPGNVATGIFAKRYGAVVGSLMWAFVSVLYQKPWDGAQRCVHVALDSKAGEVSGEFFSHFKVAKALDIAYDNEIARKLWDKTVQLVKLTDEELAVIDKK